MDFVHDIQSCHGLHIWKFEITPVYLWTGS